MSADSHDFKFTDGSERELIQQEAADAGAGLGATGSIQDMAPLLKWLLAVVLTLGSLFVIASNEL